MLRRLPLLLGTCALILLAAACGSSSSSSSAVGASSQPASAAPTDPAASLDAPDIESDFPEACGVVTPDELAAIVGNPVADGSSFASFVCDWESDVNATSVSLLLQPVPSELCQDGLPEGDSTDRFGAPATVHYDDLGNIPGAQVGVCTGPGLVLVTVTGGFESASDPERYTEQASQVMELILERL